MPNTEPYHFLNPADVADLATFLTERQWLAASETIQSVGKAGEGNMNLTLRVQTSTRTFIVKQSRPWVEKYPQIAAPAHRILMEATFYRLVANVAAITNRMPRFIGLDEANRVAVLQDLGAASDFTFLYSDGGGSLEPLPEVCQWLRALHRLSFDAEVRAQLVNRDMRKLNHEHLFHFPLLADNGLDLDAITPGLKEASHHLITNEAYVDAITLLGELYLSDGPTLLHGDFYPGSWLNLPFGIRIIDPEFAYFGRAEYDVGVLIGHLLLANRPVILAEAVFMHYKPSPGFDRLLAVQFAGMEIMRRLIGVAQLPVTMGLAKKAELLRLSERMVLDPASILPSPGRFEAVREA